MVGGPYCVIRCLGVAAGLFVALSTPVSAAPNPSAKAMTTAILGGQHLKVRVGQRRVNYVAFPAADELKFSLTGPSAFSLVIRQIFVNVGGAKNPVAKSRLRLVRDGESEILASINMSDSKGELGRSHLGVASGKWQRHLQVPAGVHHYALTIAHPAAAEDPAKYLLRLRPLRSMRAELKLPDEREIAARPVSSPVEEKELPAQGTVAAAEANGRPTGADMGSSKPPAVAPSQVPVVAIQLAVMDVVLDDPEISRVVGESLSSVLAAEIQLRGGDRFSVITRNELKSLLQQQAQAQLLGCSEAQCAMDIGKLAAAEQIVTASIGKIGQGWLFTLQRVDTGSGQVISRQSVTWHSAASGLVELCRPYVARLLVGSAAEDYSGQFELLANEADAEVHINDALVGKTPLKIVGDLAIGAHRVSISKTGFLPYSMDIVVNRDERTLLQANLIDESALQPWYRKWWVWTGAVALVGGAVTTAILLRDDRTTLDVQVGLRP